jgi:hypothetical protein
MTIELDHHEARLPDAVVFKVPAERRKALLTITRLRNPQAANLVLQCRALQSETFGGTPLACDASRCNLQSVDDYRRFSLSKRSLSEFP